LKEVVLVGQARQRRFDLGRDPTLERVESTTLVVAFECWRHLFELEDMLQDRVEEKEDFVAPAVKLGTFVKGPTDRWYCESLTPRWDF